MFSWGGEDFGDQIQAFIPTCSVSMSWTLSPGYQCSRLALSPPFPFDHLLFFLSCNTVLLADLCPVIS